MRNQLAKHDGTRKKFRGVFVRFGKKANYQGYTDMTILLTSIIDVETNQVVTDHLWFNYTKGFEDAGIKEGDVIEFEARIKEYKKGYVNARAGIRNRSRDYKLSHPTQIKVIRV